MVRGLKNEFGAEVLSARTSLRKTASDPDLGVNRGEGVDRAGFEGDPSTVSNRCDSLLSAWVDELVPNMNPPDNRLPCFFEIEPRRLSVDVFARPKVPVSGDEGMGISDALGWWDEDRNSDCGADSILTLDFSPNPFQPPASQPLLVVRGSGRAVTGRIFLRRRGVASRSVSEDSDSQSCSVLARAGKEFE